MIRVGITLGDPCGIGPELIARGLDSETLKHSQAIVYGCQALLENTAKVFGTPLKCEIVNCDPSQTGGHFSIDDRKSRAYVTMASIDTALNDLRDKKIDVLVTNPIDKSVIRTLIPTFTGHTGYLANAFLVPKTLMLLDNSELRVVLLTEHIALRDVASKLSVSEIASSVRLAAREYSRWFGSKTPRMAIVGMNPHAGEIVENAEEDVLFRPAIEQLKTEQLMLEGPYPADSFFPTARNGDWDLIFSAYHDQGLIAAKYPGLDKVVNITLGLPFLRTSPGHGTAYDLVGTGKADTRSFKRAILVAIHRRLNHGN